MEMIDLDDSDDEVIFVSPRQKKTASRGRGRGRKKTSTSSRAPTVRSSRKKLVPETSPSDEVTNVPCLETSDCSISDSPIQNETVNTEKVDPSSPPEKVRKIACRGLARKNVTLHDSEEKPKHNVSVYSALVPQRFEDIFMPIAKDSKSIESSKEPVNTVNSREVSRKAKTKEQLLNEDDDEIHTVPECKALNIDVSDDSLMKSMDESIEVRSPTPPPSIQQKKSKRLNKKLTGALQVLDKANKKLGLSPNTPKKKRDSDVILVYEETNTDMAVKVRYLSTVYRIQMKMTEKFHGLTSKLSALIGEDANNLVLYLHEKGLQLSETPRSVNLSVADILECHCINSQLEDETDSINLVLQCKNTKSRTVILASQRRPLKEVIEKYAAMMNVKSSALSFCFDGDVIDPMDTPSKLDMEDDDVIDVTEVSPHVKLKK
ncbi:NFATC2-interacting protein-like [Physella acuta]|uniref:NFATC2-interacting protein-like n=1 Tax=Physella acuta TaxID=109671 RepID=UPI0027DDA8F0|nr:NFATC2-interacting protein-like [Physella acuta]